MAHWLLLRSAQAVWSNNCLCSSLVLCFGVSTPSHSKTVTGCLTPSASIVRISHNRRQDDNFARSDKRGDPHRPQPDVYVRPRPPSPSNALVSLCAHYDSRIVEHMSCGGSLWKPIIRFSAAAVEVRLFLSSQCTTNTARPSLGSVTEGWLGFVFVETWWSLSS